MSVPAFFNNLFNNIFLKCNKFLKKFLIVLEARSINITIATAIASQK